MSVTLEIPDDFAARLQSRRAEAEAQLHLELAIALYREGQLPVARAAEVAGLKVAEFEEILRQRHVSMPYTLADLEHDITVGIEQANQGETAPLDVQAIKDEIRHRQKTSRRS